MAHKGPHISISPDYVVNRILRINIDDFAEWPESVRHLAIAIAEELFLVAYNPFINVETVRNSVHARFERESMALDHYFANAIGEGITTREQATIRLNGGQWDANVDQLTRENEKLRAAQGQVDQSTAASGTISAALREAIVAEAIKSIKEGDKHENA